MSRAEFYKRIFEDEGNFLLPLHLIREFIKMVRQKYIGTEFYRDIIKENFPVSPNIFLIFTNILE